MLQKVTVNIPADLLSRAQNSTHKGITETIRRGLELVAAQQAYVGLRSRRGKMKIQLDLTELRADRK
jgi:hypothetical protein